MSAIKCRVVFALKASSVPAALGLLRPQPR